MAKLKRIAGVIGVILLVTFLSVFAIEQGSDFLTSTVVVSEIMGATSAEAKEAVSPYEKEIEPLTTVECGQCHYSVFETIKEAGGKHQIDCIRCHREYHVYNPRKQNYDEIMPDCAWCHQSASGGAFHGENKNLTPCLNCHADPHKPLAIPVAEIGTSCALCHTKEGNDIRNYPSMHTTEVMCADCHAERHGYIPECSVCHESHSPAVKMTSVDCMVCHPVHKPTEIVYGEDTQSTICAGCHREAYHLLQANVTRHTEVACGECHPSHGEIPLCSRCHGEPHPKAMLVDTTKCGDCHGIAHDLLL